MNDDPNPSPGIAVFVAMLVLFGVTLVLVAEWISRGHGVL